MAVRFFGSKATPPRDDSLQISGAIVAPSDGPSPVELVDAGRAPHGLGVVRDQYERKIRKSPTIRMVPSSVMVEGRRLRFAVSDDLDAYGPGRTSSPRLSQVEHAPVLRQQQHVLTGVRPAWPSTKLANHGPRACQLRQDSEPLDSSNISIESLANQVIAIVGKIDTGPTIPPRPFNQVGGFAVQFAHDRPRRTLGSVTGTASARSLEDAA